jgi:hypothetical protein
MCYIDEEVTKKVRIADLPYEYVTLLKTMPTFKYWRVVTANPEVEGVRLLCSCGFGMRFLTCCLHVSLVLQKVSDYTYFGCEPENVHVRHTNLYASLDDMAVIQRTHDDWQGIFCSTVTVQSFEGVFSKNGPEETSSESIEQEDPDEHDHDTRHRDKRRTVSAEESAYKAEKIANLKSHMFDVLNIIDSATVREDIDKFVKLVEDAIFALKRQLPSLPQRSRTTIARRPAGEAQKKRRSAGRKQTKSKTSEAAAPKSMQRRASLAKRGTTEERPVLVDSDHSNSSSHSYALAGFVHGSDHETDSQTSISTESDEDNDFE